MTVDELVELVKQYPIIERIYSDDKKVLITLKKSVIKVMTLKNPGILLKWGCENSGRNIR